MMVEIVEKPSHDTSNFQNGIYCYNEKFRYCFQCHHAWQFLETNPSFEMNRRKIILNLFISLFFLYKATV